MRKLLLLLSLFSLSLFGADAQEIFFSAVKEKNQSNYLSQFSALLSSTVVNHQFKNIPKDVITLGKEPELYLKFQKGQAPILVVENVSSFYANFFAPYEEIIQKSGLFLGIDNHRNYSQFKKEYRFKIKEISEGYKVTIKEIEALPGDYAEYFYRKEFTLSRAYFYEESLKTGEIRFFYQKLENQVLPKRIIIVLHKKKRGGMKEFFVDFTRFNFEPLAKNLF